MSATKSTVRGIWRALGLGVTAGAADDDPSYGVLQKDIVINLANGISWRCFLGSCT
jgi:hypothetical protein